MSELNQYIFDIRSVMFVYNSKNLSSKEDIERTFRDF